MAMTKCKECGTEVSSSAKTCPQCGISNPGVTGGQMIVGLVAVVLIGWLVVKCSSGEDSATAAQLDPAACRADLQCWGDKHLVSAGVYCKAPVEAMAKYSARWTDGTFEPKFSRFRWLSEEQGTLTFIGDKIEFQNGFGAFQGHTYECDFSPAGDRVIDVRAQPGRL